LMGQSGQLQLHPKELFAFHIPVTNCNLCQTACVSDSAHISTCQ
jgi:hypothetical protein